MASIQKVSSSKVTIQKPVQKNISNNKDKKENTTPKVIDSSKEIKALQSYHQFVFAPKI